ncbi:hypothetical protein [Romboutsia sp.]|uniref:hypothetical protein n=1 Tax=Romboutsia sp. TaxID=1965302 RepID=UPI003F3D79FC
MSKNNKYKKDDLSFLNNLDDQYQEILDGIEINENTDSETTDLINFRVINTNNAYPNQNTVDLNNSKQNAKK